MEGPRRADRWSATTLQRVAHDYGVWLTWLAGRQLLDPDGAPRDRATREAVAAYYADVCAAGLAANTLAALLLNLGRALEAMHPEADWRWIATAGNRVQAGATQAFAGPLRDAGEVMAVGLGLMRAAEDDPWRTDSERAVLYRDGLIIAFLTTRPLRLGNLASLEIGRHLFKDERVFRVTIPAEEAKARREINFPWPDELGEPLGEYLTRHRPCLIAAGRGRKPLTNALWVSRRGTASDKGAIAGMINATTLAGLGERVNPHAFRHIAATTIATAAPNNATDAARILSHATLATTERYYNRARSLEAANDYQTALGRR